MLQFVIYMQRISYTDFVFLSLYILFSFYMGWSIIDNLFFFGHFSSQVGIETCI